MKKYLFLLFILISSLGFAQDPDQKSIDRILKGVIDPSGGPGLTVGVVKDGQLIYQNSFGLMNLEYKLPFNDSTVIGLASVTKQFTSACVGILAKRGQVSVQDDIRKYIPELAFYGDTIRIKHLLAHTSGIRNHNILLDLMGFDFEYQGYTNAMIEQLMFQQQGVNNPPGEKMLYSNTNYVLLALLVKRVSGRPIHEFAQKELFEPLGMNNTFYRSDGQEVIANRAYTYFKRGPRYKQPRSLNLCVGAGGMKSTLPDLARWAQIFLEPNHEYAYLRQFITQLDTLNNGSPMKHARGMFVSPYRNYQTYNHSGRNIAMRSQLICVPELKLAVLVYANTNAIDAVGVSYQILDLFLSPSQESIDKKAKKTFQPVSLNTFTGQYQELNSDMRMKIYEENDTLKALSSFGRMAVPLIPNDSNVYQRFDNPSVRHTFYTEESSEIAMEVDFGGAIFYFERITLNPQPNQNLDEYTGQYYSAELDVTYSLTRQNEQLVLDYPNHPGIILKEGPVDVFGSNRRTKYTFQRTENGRVDRFLVAAEGTVKDILFERID